MTVQFHAATSRDTSRFSAPARAERPAANRPGSEPGPAGDVVAARIASLHALTVAMLHLRPRAGERVLDLGGCVDGAAEWFGRVGIELVPVECARGVDPSGHAAGRRVVADAEALPLRASAFDHALCLDLAHRVGNRRRMLRELHRVLRIGGRAVIAAPGNPEAADVEDEKLGDLTVDALLRDCVRAGFVRPRLRPLSYVVPGFEIGRGRWGWWERYARTSRPARSWHRVRRAVSDAFGIERREVAFEDALGIELIRLVKGAMDRYPLVVVAKSA